ncbi:carboxypeptidase regulatory-like domain-containing protein [Anaeromyxobacter paludicola]|uniref:carboxypeptidase regulatory-like domain-containing protein n=1 Tax=Anaeromyxobacter paludicola TaxID=2918171 RepID=UPI0021D60AD3|nr:carboxypeptidase regulatory-like domain-containing protein [Anaeromyxobacter paludicola]
MLRPAVLLLAAALGLAAPVRAPAAAPARPVPGRPGPRTPGTVTGTLRHKGCQSVAAGATVAVIGRDATATTDSLGRFSISVAPGRYSLLFSGPNLVSDQRVDDVDVAPGQTRELGVVGVWPEERPQTCGSPEGQAPAEEPVVAVAPEVPSLDLPGGAVGRAPPASEHLWVRGGPGGGPGQFGMQGNPARQDEDALGPASFAVGPAGFLYVLDALNGRIARYDPRGHPAGGFPLRSQGTEHAVEADLSVSDDGHVFVFHEGEPPALAQYDAGGRVLVSGALHASFRGVDQLLCGRQRPLFLMQNGQAVRVELGWGGMRAEGPLPGLPLGNELYARADRVSRWLAAVKLTSQDGRVRRSIQLHSRVPLTGIRLVGVDRRGLLVVAVDRAEGTDENAPAAEVLLLALTAQGQLAGVGAVPPGDRRFEFREFGLAPDGTVVQMQSDASEVRFVRWVLAAPPRQAVAGEGLVRGRVTDGGHPSPGALVSVSRPRRAVPVQPDGSFEVRLPPGHYLLSVRRPGATPSGFIEPQPVERRVSVSAGATVDLGALPLPVPRRLPEPLAPRPLPEPLEPVPPSGAAAPIEPGGL